MISIKSAMATGVCLFDGSIRSARIFLSLQGPEEMRQVNRKCDRFEELKIRFKKPMIM